MSPEEIVLSCALVLGLVALGLYVMWSVRESGTKRTALSRLAGAVGGSVSGERVTGTHEGVQFDCLYRPRERGFTLKSGFTSGFTVTVRSHSPGYFTVTRGRAVDRLSKGIGLAREIETGDSSFDRDFYLWGNPEFLASVFASPEKRNTVRELFSLGTTELEHDDGFTSAGWSGLRLDRKTDLRFVTRAVACLATLGKGLPAERSVTRLSAPGAPEATRLTWITPYTIFLVSTCSVAGGVAGLGWLDLLFWHLDDGEVFVGSLKYSVPALIVFWAWAFHVLKRGPGASRNFLIIVAVCSLIGFPVSGFDVTAALKHLAGRRAEDRLHRDRDVQERLADEAAGRHILAEPRRD